MYLLYVCLYLLSFIFFFFFFFNDTATTEIYTLSLHDALPIPRSSARRITCCRPRWRRNGSRFDRTRDRKSTRLNSSHDQISYAVFCCKKKKFSQTDDRNLKKNDIQRTNIKQLYNK